MTTPPRPHSEAGRAIRRATPKILLVDDAASNLVLLEAVLRGGGYTQLVSTADPTSVLGLVRKHRPDLVLLDLRMPRKDGFEVMEELRAAGPGAGDVPIIVLTATADRHITKRALASGAADLVTKPFDPTDVLLKVRAVVGPGGRTHAPVRRADERGRRQTP